MTDREEIARRIEELRTFAGYAILPDVRERYQREADALARQLAATRPKTDHPRSA